MLSMSLIKLRETMNTLPKGMQLLEVSAPSAAEVRQKKNLSALLERMECSCLSAAVPRANFKAALQQAAVNLYLKQIENPSDQMDDPVMLLLEKAQSLQLSEPSSSTGTT